MTLRATALLALGAFAVHQARYALVPDPHGDGAHGYLAAAPVLLALLVALAAGRTLRALARGGSGCGARWSWAAASGALLALHAVQEGAERVLAGGGPLDAGALLVVPLCLVAGALVALALRESGTLLDGVAATAPRALRRPVAAVLAPRAPVRARRGTVVARHLAGRAPPALD